MICSNPLPHDSHPVVNNRLRSYGQVCAGRTCPEQTLAGGQLTHTTKNYNSVTHNNSKCIIAPDRCEMCSASVVMNATWGVRRGITATLNCNECGYPLVVMPLDEFMHHVTKHITLIHTSVADGKGGVR